MEDKNGAVPQAEPRRKSWAHNTARGVAWVAAFLVAFFAVKYVKQAWFEQRATEKAFVELDQMRADAAKSRPDLPAAQAYQEAAAKQLRGKLASQAGDKQAETAADMYWGFLFVNTRARVAFCEGLGVDISPFAKAFESLHINETAKARAIYARLSAVTEDAVYEKIKGQLSKTVDDDMNGIAATQKISVVAACQLFSDHGQEIANEMLLSTVHPALYEALRAAK